MNIGHWLKSLSTKEQLFLLALFIISIYLSKKTLESMIEYYDIKKHHSEFRVRYRVTPASLLLLAFFYSFLIYQVLDSIFNFMP
tara:strand:+ start:53 stop:304 length:252 start_codon:yes stop_codon:yes gene_type:complete